MISKSRGGFADPAQQPAAWKHDPALQKALRLASWRFENLIGITLPDTEEEEQAAEGDRARYAHFMHKTDDGFPIWYPEEATTFVAEVAGVGREIAAAWLDCYVAEIDRVAGEEIDWHTGAVEAPP